MINIFDIQPHEVSDNIQGYVIGIMGPPGKLQPDLCKLLETPQR